MKKLGFGTMRLPLLDSSDPTSIDMEQFCQMADEFIQRGFTYFDTAYMYHNHKSEIAVREAVVKRHPRDQFTLASKLPMSMINSAEQQQTIFEEQLEKCGVDYFDYYLLHNLTKISYKKAEEFGSFAFAMQKKAEGKVRHVGFSFHDEAALLDEILTKHPEVEFVQLQLNYIDWDSQTIQSRACYEVCVKHNKPVIVMEPVKGGILVNSLPQKAKDLYEQANPNMSVASWAVRFAASLDNVMMVLSGMSSLEQLQDNLSYMEEFQPLSEEEHATIQKVVGILNESALVPCTACAYCVEGCPMHIQIPKYFAAYNAVKQFGEKVLGNQRMYYSVSAEGNGKASACIECGQCERICPQHLPIIKLLKDVAETFEEPAK